MRDIEGAYRQALLEEYASYQQAGRTAQAAHVAAELKARYGVDVGPDAETAPEHPREPEPPTVETAAAEPPPETVAEEKPKPRRGRPPRQAATED